MSTAFSGLNTFTGRPWCHKCHRMGCIGGASHYTFNFRIWLQAKRQRFHAWRYRFDYSKIDDVEIDGIDTRDYPDFCDAFIASATYKGREMTEAQLERLNEDSSYVYECVIERLY